MLQAARIGIDEARLLALRERAAGAALAHALAPAWGAAAGAATLAAALATEGHDLEAAARGRGEELARRLELPVLAHRTPLVLHVVAVLFERIADGLEHSRALRCDAKAGGASSSLEHSRALRCDAKAGGASSSLEHSRDGGVVVQAASLRRRAYEAWRLLAQERTYLQNLLARMAKNDESGAIPAIIAGRPAAVLAGWVQSAQPALLAHAPRGIVMLRVLRDLERDAELAEVARAARESLIDALLAPLRHEDVERSAGRAEIPERIAGLTAWAPIWHATEGDAYFALRTLERLVDLGWELRSAGKYLLLRELYEPFRPLLEVLANEVRLCGPASSYASLVGDGFVQLASATATVPGQIATCERALVICPRHKLAESMLAFYLAQRGIELMVAANDVVSPALAHELEGLIVRATKLDASDARLQVFRERYRAVTGRTP